jgi:hypothetical protein
MAAGRKIGPGHPISAEKLMAQANFPSWSPQFLESFTGPGCSERVSARAVKISKNYGDHDGKLA